jgi:hypothetical protein
VLQRLSKKFGIILIAWSGGGRREAIVAEEDICLESLNIILITRKSKIDPIRASAKLCEMTIMQCKWNSCGKV